MAHHGWIPVDDPRTLTPSGLQSPFGRLFEAADHSYSSMAISHLAGAGGPIEKAGQAVAVDKLPAKPTNPAGFTFLGQFIDHDLTEFRVLSENDRIIPSNPVIGQRQRVLEDGAPTCTNGRIGSLDLDSVYGLLGKAQPDLYDSSGLFLLDSDQDIRRDTTFQNGRLIADPRNDENKLILQIHMLFQRLHNQLHAGKSGNASEKCPGGSVFAETRRQVLLAYRRIVLHDYLPRIVQPPHLTAVLGKLAAGETFYQAMNRRATRAFQKHLGESAAASAAGGPSPNTVAGGAVPGTEQDQLIAMPVEFAHAVFRLGHSQLRAGYQLRPGLGVPLFGVPTDLRGNSKLVDPAKNLDFRVDWSLFFDKPGQETAQHGEPLDANLPAPVFRLPPPAIGEPPLSLAERNIRRGVDFGLPSGQQAASYLTSVYGGIPGVPASDLFPESEFRELFREVLAAEPAFAWATPLWYYMLRESGLYRDGPQLGAVGGLIVAETILGCLSATDPAEFDLAAEAEATPATSAPSGPEGVFSMTQLLQLLGIF